MSRYFFGRKKLHPICLKDLLQTISNHRTSFLLNKNLKKKLFAFLCRNQHNNNPTSLNLDTPHHGLWTPGEEISFTARTKIKYQSQIFRCSQSILFLPNWPKISKCFDLCLHLVSVHSPWPCRCKFASVSIKKKASFF